MLSHDMQAPDVDGMAERMHAAYGWNMGKVAAPWPRCRKETRQEWRKEARRLLGSLAAALMLKR